MKPYQTLLKKMHPRKKGREKETRGQRPKFKTP
jgi:hypothetical protein